MRTLVLLVLFVATLPVALGQTTIHTQSTSKELLLQDYDYFFSQLEQIHPDPYSAFGGKDEFDKAVKQLRDELASRGSMTLNEMQVEVTRLISALHDGHTYMEYDHATKKEEDRWIPLKLKVIPDGIIVNGYAPELESLKGAMLCEVEGEALELVLNQLDKIVISENRYGLKSDVIVADVFARMLREMKAANSQRLIIDLRGNNGGWTMIMYAALYELYGKRFMDTDLGMHFATKVSDGWLKKNNTSLEQLNQDRGTSLKMGDFIEQSSSISNFDLFMCADMSIIEAQEGAPIYTPKEIYVVTDVQTFSAAFHTAYMLWKMGAKVVGVPSGQAPNTYMEVTRFKLPNTGLECSVSNSLQSCFPTDHPMAKTFTPDIQLSYDEYRQSEFSKDAELLYIEKLKIVTD